MECDKFFCGKSSFNRIELGLTDVSVSGCRGAVFFFRSRSQNNEVATARFGERAMRLLVVLECLARFLYEETNLHVDLVPLLPVCRALAVWNTALQDWLNNTVRAVARYQLAFAVAVTFLVRTSRRASACHVGGTLSQSTWSGWESGVNCRSRC